MGDRKAPMDIAMECTRPTDLYPTSLRMIRELLVQAIERDRQNERDVREARDLQAVMRDLNADLAHLGYIDGVALLVNSERGFSYPRILDAKVFPIPAVPASDAPPPRKVRYPA